MRLIQTTDCDCGQIRPKYYIEDLDGNESEHRFGFSRVDSNGNELDGPHIFMPCDLQDMIYCVKDVKDTLQWGYSSDKLDPSGFVSPIPPHAADEVFPFSEYENAAVERSSHYSMDRGHVRPRYWEVTVGGETELGFSFTRVDDNGSEHINPDIFLPCDIFDFMKCVNDIREYYVSIYHPDLLRR